MTKSQTQPSTKQEHPAELVDFANARGRPSVFLVLLESLAPNHLNDLQSALGDQQFDDMDIVIQSGGGNRQRLEVLNELVHRYPSHDYIIDFRELQELGLNAKLFALEEGDAAYRAMTCSLHEAGENGAFVRLVSPTKPTRKTRASDAKEE